MPTYRRRRGADITPQVCSFIPNKLPFHCIISSYGKLSCFLIVSVVVGPCLISALILIRLGVTYTLQVQTQVFTSRRFCSDILGSSPEWSIAASPKGVYLIDYYWCVHTSAFNVTDGNCSFLWLQQAKYIIKRTCLYDFSTILLRSNCYELSSKAAAERITIREALLIP